MTAFAAQTQLAVFSASYAGTPEPWTVQAAALTSYTSSVVNVPLAQQTAVAVAWGPPQAASATNHQTVLQTASGSDAQNTVPRAHQSCVLIAYGTGIREDRTQRAWTFDMDGHSFYVYQPGMQPTLVYDLTTAQWAEWRTEGYPFWNAQLGTRWRDRAVCADIQQGAIYEIDPAQPLDEGFRPMRRIVTGMVTLRGRDTLSCDAFHIVASPGFQQDPDASTPVPATMVFRFSDDAGATYHTFGTITLLVEQGTQDYSVRSLGRMETPGRVFEIEDFGGPIRIDAVSIDTPED